MLNQIPEPFNNLLRLLNSQIIESQQKLAELLRTRELLLEQLTVIGGSNIDDIAGVMEVGNVSNVANK